MNARFWKQRRVFVTGHTGFKGSWLSLWLQMMGARVTGYALEAPTEPSLFDVASVARGMRSLRGDVRDLAPLKAALRAARPEVVIHMAAQSLVRRSYVEPVETFAANVMGTVNLLEAVRHCGGVRATLVVTSDKCYENREWLWGYREDDLLGGHDPYSASKGCAELVVNAYRRSFLADRGRGQPRQGVASARAGNVIGGGDWAADRLVPDFVRAAAAGRKLVVRSPAATRPWQHVMEPLRGYLELVERLWADPSEFGGAWNFGPDADAVQPVAAVADELTRLWGGRAGWKAAPSRRAPHEASLLALDCAKARFRLGWRPWLRLAEALSLTAEWYRAHLQSRDMRAATEAQIEAYARRSPA